LTILGIFLASGVADSFLPVAGPLIFLFWLSGFFLILVFALIRMVGALRGSGLRGLAACAVYCAIGVGAFWQWQRLLAASVYFGDYVHFQVSRSSYEKQVSATPTSDGLRFVRFDWGGFMLNPIEVVYDESDEVALQEDQRSEAWKERVGIRSEYYGCSFGALPLAKHYYIVRFSC
jgi:hypothetical protein